MLLGVTVRFKSSVKDIRSLALHLSASFFTPREPASPRSTFMPALTPALTPAAANAVANATSTTRAPLGKLKDNADPASRAKCSSGKASEQRAATLAARARPVEPPDVLVDATGARCELFETLGLTQV